MSIKHRVSREPLVTAGAVTSGVAAIIALVVAFGVELSEAQTEAILGVAAFAAPFIVALVARRYVSPAGEDAPRS